MNSHQFSLCIFLPKVSTKVTHSFLCRTTAFIHAVIVFLLYCFNTSFLISLPLRITSPLPGPNPSIHPFIHPTAARMVSYSPLFLNPCKMKFNLSWGTWQTSLSVAWPLHFCHLIPITLHISCAELWHINRQLQILNGLTQQRFISYLYKVCCKFGWFPRGTILRAVTQRSRLLWHVTFPFHHISSMIAMEEKERPGRWPQTLLRFILKVHWPEFVT